MIAAARNLLDRVVGALPDGVPEAARRNDVGAVISDAGRILAANDYFYDLVGVEAPLRGARPLSWVGITPPEFISADAAAIGRARMAGTSEAYEKQYEQPDGSRVSIVVACAVVSPEPLPLFALVARADDPTARAAGRAGSSTRTPTCGGGCPARSPPERRARAPTGAPHDPSPGGARPPPPAPGLGRPGLSGA